MGKHGALREIKCINLFLGIKYDSLNMTALTRNTGLFLGDTYNFFKLIKSIFWLFLLSHSIEDHFYTISYFKKNVTQRCPLSSAQAAALCDFLVPNMQVQHTENILHKIAASTCSQHSSTYISLPPSPTPRKLKPNKKEINVKAAYFCGIPIQTAHSTVSEESSKLPEGDKQADPQELAFMLRTDCQRTGIRIYTQDLNFTAAHLFPAMETALRQAHKASSLLLHPPW